jgi:hypothetical protein
MLVGRLGGWRRSGGGGNEGCINWDGIGKGDRMKTDVRINDITRMRYEVWLTRGG